MYNLLPNWPLLSTGYQLGQPTGIDIDINQNVVVFIRAGRTWTDPFPDSYIAEKTILVLDRVCGNIINSWGDNLFIMPHGLKVDDYNNTWVTDVGLHQVFKFDHQGKLLMAIGEARVAGDDASHFNLPTDIAIAPDGSFYVSDGYGNSRIVKFSSTGEYLFEWGRKGEEPGEFNMPHGIDLDKEGNVYVADRENNRLQVFDGAGKFLKEWRSVGKLYSLTINKITGNLVAVDYVIDDPTPIGSDLMIFDSGMDQPTRIGRSGSYDGPACEYHGITVDDEENIYVGDILGTRIYKFEKPDTNGDR